MLRVFLTFFLFTFFTISPSDAQSVGEKIAIYAEKFIGTPYDPDPLGSYVRKRLIINDGMVDCMYLTFRAVELALADSEEDSIKIALDKRFVTRGILSGDGTVLNYDERFQYGEDMIDSGKFGEEITSSITDNLINIKGARGRDFITIIPKEYISNILSRLVSGDIVFFIKYPEHRIFDEIVGHIGILKREGESLYLIHASGKKNNKNNPGKVIKVPFQDYVKVMPFAGIRITRFSQKQR